MLQANQEAARAALQAQEQIKAMGLNLDQARAMMATRINNTKLLAQLQVSLRLSIPDHDLG